MVQRSSSWDVYSLRPVCHAGEYGASASEWGAPRGEYEKLTHQFNPYRFDADEWRRYTDFGFYEDRVTRDIVLTRPEQPKISKKDFTSDCYRYRITV